MEIWCTTEVINTLFECETYRFICTRKTLAEKIKNFFFFLPCSSQELHMSYLFFLSSEVCSVNSGLGNQWSLENCLEMSHFHQKRLVVRLRSY